MTDEEFAQLKARVDAKKAAADAAASDYKIKHDDRVEKGRVANEAHLVLLTAIDAKQVSYGEYADAKRAYDSEYQRRSALPKK